MNKIKIFCTFVAILVMISCVALFAGCSKDDAEPKATATATASATATAKPTEAATATPEATATPTPSKRNLLSYAIEDDPTLIDGDKWVAQLDKWAGPLNEKRDGCESFAQQEFTEATLPDGTEGTCYHFFSEAETGFHVIGNTFGLWDTLEANKSYTLTVTLKYTVPNPGTNLDNMHVGYSLDSTSKVKVAASEEWQTVTCNFKTGADIPEGQAYIYVGPATGGHPSIMIGDIQAGFDLLICDVSLVEAE